MVMCSTLSEENWFSLPENSEEVTEKNSSTEEIAEAQAEILQKRGQDKTRKNSCISAISPSKIDQLMEVIGEENSYEILCKTFNHEAKAVLEAWVLERFPRMRLAHGMLDIRDDETRLARWAKLVHKSTDYATLKSSIRGEHFVCQPYVKDTNHFIAHLVYKTTWSIEKVGNEEVDLFARCVMVSKLVRLDISQRYFPHRVNKQFGYHQDIPVDVILLESIEEAWANHATPLKMRIYTSHEDNLKVVLIFRHGSDTAYLLLYVDDIVLTASSTAFL
ncbi:protein maintenance of meristems [Tanacetum coccineum]